MPELTVVIPTERTEGGLDCIVARIRQGLPGIDWEVVFVDDDSDGTRLTGQALAQADPRVRFIWRVGRRGLSTAIREGVCSSSAPFFAVMTDGERDDERVLSDMLARLKADGLDIVIGSRENVAASQEALAQRVAMRFGRSVIRAKVSDPTSGFFMMRREAFDSSVRRLSGIGFGILLDLFASSEKPLRHFEIPVSARPDAPPHESAAFAWEMLTVTLDKTIGRFLPTRFILFGLVGGSGVFVHLGTLWCGLALLGFGFLAAQALATIVATTSNFFLNNILTFRDQRLRGLKCVQGLLSFYLVCGVGWIGNVGFANFIYEQDRTWWLAGGAGTIVGAVWNFASSSVFTWRGKPTRSPAKSPRQRGADNSTQRDRSGEGTRTGFSAGRVHGA